MTRPLEVQFLKDQLLRLRQELHVRPIGRPPIFLPTDAAISIIIIGGQTMGTFNGITTYGIEKFAGTLSGIPNGTYNPGTVNPSTGAETAGPTPAITAWQSGIGYGTARIDDIYVRVIVVNDSRGGCANALIGGASDDTTYAPSTRQVTILTTRLLSVSKADLSTVPAYSPDLG